MNKATSALDSENVAIFVHSLHAKQARFMNELHALANIPKK
jgi:hypothetical protein